MIDRKRKRLLAALTATIVGCALLTGAAATHSRASTRHSGRVSMTAATAGIGHVWVIPLENQSYSQTFGKPSADPYLARTLTAKGALLEDYYGIAHDSLGNYIAMISGQAPNFQTGQDCEYFSRFLAFDGENFNGFTRYGQLSGDGCVYPDHLPRYSVQTLGNQLTAHHLSWKAYEEDMGNDPHRDGTVMTAAGPACGHPYVGDIDLTDITAPAADSYATRHDPFMYFKSIIKPRSYCAKHVVSLSPLAGNLRTAATTPHFS
ncbi:MAG TPA: alkaline phosphatase family protein, partial [Gaiellales bacterium]|nr:alkaline phosphatase family protein [Gaiellales bacterium]